LARLPRRLAREQAEMIASRPLPASHPRAGIAVRRCDSLQGACWQPDALTRSERAPSRRAAFSSACSRSATGARLAACGPPPPYPFWASFSGSASRCFRCRASFAFAWLAASAFARSSPVGPSFPPRAVRAASTGDTPHRSAASRSALRRLQLGTLMSNASRSAPSRERGPRCPPR
jgi:hypothetical protein